MTRFKKIAAALAAIAAVATAFGFTITTVWDQPDGASAPRDKLLVQYTVETTAGISGRQGYQIIVDPRPELDQTKNGYADVKFYPVRGGRVRDTAPGLAVGRANLTADTLFNGELVSGMAQDNNFVCSTELGWIEVMIWNKPDLEDPAHLKAHGWLPYTVHFLGGNSASGRCGDST